ncbi:MAG: ABC transporter substrate-binding protein, partial [Spirochaetaceae bacterium]|nr:ABC transporter substrate-binding protein [Spirochaetaceae bacterium]
WDDLLIVAEKLKNNGITPFSLGSKNRWPSQFWFEYILLRTAGYNYREDLMNKTARYTDLEVLRTMDIWKNLLDKDFINKDHKDMTWDNAAQLLVDEKAAMTLMGTWAIPYLEKEGMIPEVDYGFFPFPTIDNTVKTVALGPIDGVLLSSGSKKMEISKEILSLFAEKDIQEGFNLTSGAIAPFNGVNEEADSAIQLQIKSLIRKSPYWAFNYDLATEPATSEAGLNFFRDFLDSPDQYECLLIELQERIQND